MKLVKIANAEAFDDVWVNPEHVVSLTWGDDIVQGKNTPDPVINPTTMIWCSDGRRYRVMGGPVWTAKALTDEASGQDAR